TGGDGDDAVHAAAAALDGAAIPGGGEDDAEIDRLAVRIDGRDGAIDRGVGLDGVRGFEPLRWRERDAADRFADGGDGNARADALHGDVRGGDDLVRGRE